ncbi:MAG: transposase [Elusimicrobiota bacterium]|nr:transposase [Elusimicrobiota bacterium]
MPRIPRGDTTNRVFHVTARGVERRVIFVSDADRRFFLKTMRATLLKHGTRLFAYCLMPNHVHLLLGTTSVPLAAAMHELLLRYSLNFNGHQARVGHLFQSRYHTRPCYDPHHLINIVPYIHLNPVKAALARSPDAWPWSSHSEFMGGRGENLSLDALSSMTGVSLAELRRVYVDRISGRVREPRDAREILREAAASVGIDPYELTTGRRGNLYTTAKRAAIAMADKAGLSLDVLAAALNCTASALSHLREN